MSASKSKSSASETRHPRLQKVLAAGGIGSRRQCEELIVEGRVEVDREVVTELGTRVDPDTQAIRVDGVTLKRKRRRYFAVHKPNGVVSTAKDQWRRTRVIDLVDANDRVFSIGRLDKESSGLILVTNDGELANRLTHPRYGVQKVYHVTVVGAPGTAVLQKLRRGLILAEGRVKPESISVKKRLKQSTILEIVLTEGKNREIRRMLARVDHKVVKLHRVAMGPIRLGQLPKGAHRELSRAEVKQLQDLAATPQTGPKPPRKKKTRRRPLGAPTNRKGKKPTAKPAGKKGAKRGAKKGTKRGKPATPKMGAVIR